MYNECNHSATMEPNGNLNSHNASEGKLKLKSESISPTVKTEKHGNKDESEDGLNRSDDSIHSTELPPSKRSRRNVPEEVDLRFLISSKVM